MMSFNYRSEIIRKARQIWALDPLFLDTETTGLGERAEIVEVCLVDSSGNRLFDTLVRPRSSIPADATRLHGIRDEHVVGAKTWLQIWPEIESLMIGRYIGVYNAEFDLKMMQQSHRTNGMVWRQPAANFFDIMKMYADFVGSSRWQKLEFAARHCGLNPGAIHRAYQDNLLARGVFLYMLGESQE